MCPTSKGGFGLRRVEDELGNQMVRKDVVFSQDFVKGIAAVFLDANVLMEDKKSLMCGCLVL